MVTANILRECWQRVVDAYREGLTFTSEWSEVLDHDGDKHLPNVKWMPPTVTVAEEGDIVRTNYTVTLFFEDNHEADRESSTRDSVYERMQVVALMCLLMFRRTFIDAETPHEGVQVRLEQVGPANITAAFDQPGTQITGCMVTVTYSDLNQICPDPYFDAI